MFSKGQEIGVYSLIKLIGKGGFGEVWLAERRGRFVTTQVAIKLPHGEKINVEEIKNEAVLWAQASGHPNVLPIIEADEYGGQIVIVSEYAPDGSVGDLLKRERVLRARKAVELIIGVLHGLEFLHSKDIIHRDLKPANILLQGETPRLVDFGLSRVLKMNSISVTMSGTPSYMAPEAFDRKRNVQTDVWSAGVILYEMLNGELPFPQEHLVELFAAVIKDEPTPFIESVPEALRTIILTALAKEPAERYTSARMMRQVLNDFLVSVYQQSLDTTISSDRHLRTVRVEKVTGEIEGKPGLSEIFASVADDDLPFTKDAIVVSPTNSLTRLAAPIIGREWEIAEIQELLRRPDVRLVTMTGIGGTGKTTLAFAAVGELSPEFADGVFFIELAGVNNLDLVASTIAQPLDVNESGSKPMIDILCDFLSDKQILLVLDNFEQITDAAPQVGQMLASSPGLKILVTSRISLHLSAEHEFVVTPLLVPSPSLQIPLDELSNFEAVKLFVERAQRSKNSFALTSENAESVVKICARLDGLPLAIELAAARVKTLTPQAILTKLENRLKLLTGGARDLPERQQTVRGSIEWSDELLTEEQRLFFHDLAVFAGGFTCEAAEAVVNKQTDFDVLDGITSLVDKSLLVANEQSDGNSRFRMLAVVHEYALEFFEQSSEFQIVRRNHAAHFLALAEEAEPHLSGAKSAKWLHLLEDEHDNVRAALEWSLTHDTEIAACLAAALRYFWSRQNHLIEARKWFELALEKGGTDIPVPVRFKLLNGNGMFARQQGDYEKARKMYEMGFEEGRAADDGPQIANSSRGLGMVAVKQKDFDTARKYLEESLAISRTLEDNFNIALTLSMLGDLARSEGDSAAARAHFEAALVITRQLDDKWFLTSNLNNLGFVAYDLGDYESSLAYFAEALAMVREFGNKIITSYTIDGFSALAIVNGDVKRAAHLAGAAENLRASMGSEIEPAERRFRDEYLAKIREKINAADLDLAYETGRSLTLEDTVELCLNNRKDDSSLKNASSS
ncbi:MAG: protein kinase domain-containing protein [Pyrinomonadaceae bacterium]